MIIDRRLITGKWILWSVMGLMGLAVLIHRELPYLSPDHPLRPHHLFLRDMLLPHLAFGCIAMFAGPLQFSSRLRTRHMRLHRVLGHLYAWSIFVSAPLATIMPLRLHQDHFYVAGTFSHAGTWLICTVVAYVLALNRQVQAHRQWMVRSYAMTFSFIVVRVIGHWLPLPDPEFGIFDVINTLALLLLADIALNWRELTVRRASQLARGTSAPGPAR